MGANWGISRTMAETHALLFVSRRPLCTDDVMEALQVSRGNASMNLRQLVAWGLIYRTHLPGDRKEYFLCESDVWQMFETIMRERRRREIEPIVETIERCRGMVSDHPPDGRTPDPGNPHQATEAPAAEVAEDINVYRQRLDEMLDFLNLMNTLFNVISQGGKQQLPRFASMLQAIAK